MSSHTPSGHSQTVPGTASHCCSRPSAPPPDVETAPKHDDDFEDLAEVAFRMPPALRQQSSIRDHDWFRAGSSGNVFRSTVTAQTNHAPLRNAKFIR